VYATNSKKVAPLRACILESFDRVCQSIYLTLWREHERMENMMQLYVKLEYILTRYNWAFFEFGCKRQQLICLSKRQNINYYIYLGPFVLYSWVSWLIRDVLYMIRHSYSLCFCWYIHSTYKPHVLGSETKRSAKWLERALIITSCECNAGLIYIKWKTILIPKYPDQY